MSYYSDSILSTSGLLGYWRLGETSGTIATDSSNNARHGTYGAGVTLGQSGAFAGEPSALAMQGNNVSNSRVLIPTFPSLSSFTISGWVFQTSASQGYIGASAIGGKGARMIARINGSYDGVYVGDGAEVALQPIGAVNQNVWVHYAMTYDSSNRTVTSYRNGVFVTSSVVGGVLTGLNFPSGFVLGNAGDGLTPLVGKIQDIATWSTVLTATELLRQYTAGTTTTFATPPAVTSTIVSPAQPTVNWKFFLATSSNMNYIGDITNTQDKNLTVALNNGGTFSARIPHDHPVAPYINPVTTCVVAIKNGNVVWSGPVWTIEDTVPDKNCSINCVGWFELLLHRLILVDTTFTSTDAGSIAQQLINATNAVLPTGITVGSVETTQVRTKAYKKFQNIGQEIQNLTEIESGFDWYIDPVTRVFSIYAQKMTTRTNIVFGYRWGPENLSSVAKSTDSSTLVNSMYATGASTTSGPANDTISQATYGLFQEDASLSEVVNTTILTAFANAEIAIRAAPRIIYRIVPMPDTLIGTNYSLFEDYTIGDKVYFNCNFGRISTGSTPQAIRVFNTNITIDENGIERITELQASP